jgi:uncharacterized SAM-binding protein YcdF (DUF218 family)
MHQVASAFLSFFLSPFNWMIILAIAGYLFRKSSYKKFCRIMVICIFIVFSNKWLLNVYAKKWQPPPISISKDVVYSCGIVPGGFASPDAQGNGYFNATADRFIQTEKLFRLGSIKHILISGGNGKDDNKNFREGAWVKGELTAMGIPDSVIFVEDQSNDTFDNARNAKPILDSMQLAPPYLLITSASHVPRASLIFKNAGLITIAFPCNYTEGRSSFSISSIIPQPSVLLDWDIFLKETAAYVWYYFYR